MRKLGISVIVIITAVVTAILTSLFWLALYSAPAAGPSVERAEDAPSEAEVAAVLGHNRAAPGTVEKLFFSQGGGGITAYVRSEDGRWTYYYAHLQDYAPGLREGQKVGQGDPIGRVGSTGNANPAGPHLHFAIHRMAEGEKWHEGTAINQMQPNEKWWHGSAINPYPLLAGRKADG